MQTFKIKLIMKKNFKINNNITFNGYNVVKVNMSADFQPISVEGYLAIAYEEGYKIEDREWLPEVEEIVISKDGKEYLVCRTNNGVEFCFLQTDITEMTLEIDEDVVTLEIDGVPMRLERSVFDRLLHSND